MRLVGTIAEDLGLLQYAERLGTESGGLGRSMRRYRTGAELRATVEQARLPGHDTAGRGRWSAPGWGASLAGRVGR